MIEGFSAGAAQVDITPRNAVHLFGYPHVERYSTGAHDPLLASVLYLHDGSTPALFISCDLIFVPKDLVARARTRIEKDTCVPTSHILITATHTHSGPDTVRYLSNEEDSTVPPPDPHYLRRVEDAIVRAAGQAVAAACPARAGLVRADGSRAGTNRRDPAGPSDPQVPVLIVRPVSSGTAIGLLLVCAMHPTVLHEDSTLISGDFPGMTRRYLQRQVLNSDCPVVCCMGASGNQSPRHVTKANTFQEAERLGHALGEAAANALGGCVYTSDLQIRAAQTFIDLPLRTFPSVEEAQQRLAEAKAHFAELQANGTLAPEVRTAECDLFGAQETVTLAKAVANGRLSEAAATCLPAEIQLIQIGPWRFVAWPGELFVEFALEIKKDFPDTYIITAANGELQGYVATEKAVREGGYEVSNAIFLSPDSGHSFVDATRNLIGETSP